jgi:TRAP-type C4-dicarboxylate transport system permease small subunit
MAKGRATAMAKKRKKTAAKTRRRAAKDPHLIVVTDQEVVIERHPEDWIAILVFWSLAFIVFLQFFTRYVLNDSLSWTEEIARYGLMWLTFIGGAVVTRKNTQIAVELLSNLMKPGPLRVALHIFVDAVTLGFIALLSYFAVTIIERMHYQRMTVFDLPMSIVYGGVAFGIFLMLARQIHTVWQNYRQGWRRPHPVTQQIPAD